MDGPETRELAYFVAVAEELHFGRAAERLGIAQPPLSRAIKRLERRLGVTLLERTSRRVTLTTAGAVLLAEGRRALEATAAAGRRARRAGLARPRLVVATKLGGDGGLLPDIVTAFEAEPGGVDVDVLTCGMGEQVPLVRDGRADVALLRGHHDDLRGLDTETLLIEGQVAVVSPTHRLAALTQIRLADLAEDAVPSWPHLPTADVAATATEAGSSAPGRNGSAPPIHDTAQLMQLVALGRVIALLPESARLHVAHDLVCLPVPDAPAVPLTIAWPEQSTSPEVATFVRVATAVAATAGAVGA